MRYAMTLALLLFTPGCMKGYINAENTHDAVVLVCDRHDALLQEHPPLRGDGSVDTAKLESQLRTSAMVRRVYDEALKETADGE